MRAALVGSWATALLVACTGSINGPGADGNGAGGSAASGVGASSGTAGGSAAGGGASGAGAGAGTGNAGVPATDPGRVTLHRLNRAEYNNTVRDLLGTSSTPADAFPMDDRGSGFDNIADVLTLSPLHLNLYHQAAEALVSETLGNAAQRARVVTCDLATGGEACARASLSDFTRRAWRRPVTEDELTKLMAVVATAVTQGDGYEQGFSLALRAVLLSPNFIFRVELDPDPASLTPHPLTGYEIASRLSYFLWSSMPDEPLFQAAGAGTLSGAALLESEVGRMLRDPKAQALIDNFAGQWLYLRAIDDVAPDPQRYPSFDAPLRAAMKAETALLFREVAFGTLPANGLLTADFTFANDRLARHYGLPAVGTTEMTRVSLAGSTTRGGLLGHASFLTQSSHPNRTSPVRRGKWVMEELLCATIAPPDPNLDMSGVEADIAQGLTQRQVLARHAAEPTCAGCHVVMDPVGLGLENYDAIGAYRTQDGANAIDASGELPNGELFTGPKELATLLARDPEFARCLTEKLYVYALGRAPDRTPGHMDGQTLAALIAKLTDSGYSFPALAAGIATSPTFLNRRGEPGAL